MKTKITIIIVLVVLGMLMSTGMAAAKRAIFVTDVFLNFKWGQENWAAEEE